MATWILVAQRAGARLLERNEVGAPPRILERFEHPEGRLRDAQLGASRPGVAHDSGRHKAGLLAGEESPSAHLAGVFARTLAQRLEQGRIEGRYQNLVIVAAPKLLGTLRKALPVTVQALVRNELCADLGRLRDDELIERIDELLRAGRATVMVR